MAHDKNYIERMVEYIKRNLKKGFTRDSLKFALISQGHSKFEVEKALKVVEKQLASEAPVLQTKPEIKVEIIPSVEKKPGLFSRIFKSFKIID